MIRAIIVDDEEQVRYGLGRFFDFAKYGITISDYAANGAEALALIRKKCHQLVITDVRMPVMDGIALCRQLHEEFHDDIQTLFISAHNELDYVHSAIKLGAVDYLTKPIDEAEFHDVMERVSGRIKRMQNMRREEESYRAQLSESHHAVLERYYAGLLSGAGYQPPPSMLALPEAGSYTPLMLHLNPEESSRSLLPLRDMCIRLLEKDGASCVVKAAPGEICMIRYTSQQEAAEGACALAAKIRQAAGAVLPCIVSIGVGQPGPLRDLGQNYATLKAFVEQQLLSEESQITVYTPPNPSGLKPFALDANSLALLTAALESKAPDRIGALLDGLFDRMRAHPNATREYCRIAALQLLIHAAAYLHAQGISSFHEKTDAALLSRKLHSFYVLDDLKSFVHRQLLDYLQMLGAKQAEHSGNTVSHMKKVIHMRFSQALTVQEIAQEVFLSVPYACTLFKQETGETINEYLTRHRMKKACEMLLDRRYKLYQIGAAVGYADPAYFARLFRRYMGQNPNTYRKSRQMND